MTKEKLKLGVFLPSYAFSKQKTKYPSTFRLICDVVLECERLGYDSVWFDDHLMFKNSPLLECWTTLSAIASITRNIRLGTMVTCNGFRNPALLAKMAATVDTISQGRLELGIGAGVQEEEHEAYGFSFPEPAERIKRMSEAIEIIKCMWTKDQASYKGNHYKITGAICEPKPVQKPHPPIIIGGSGERHTLKVTAKYANRFDFGYQPSTECFKHKLQVLESQCKKVGREFSDIEKSCWPAGQIILAHNQCEIEEKAKKLKPKGMRMSDFEKFTHMGKPDTVRAMLKPYVDLGVNHFMLFFGDLPDLDSLRFFAENC